jgi:hypothetical protein
MALQINPISSFKGRAMTIFTVYAKELVFYKIRVEAENKESAYQRVFDYGADNREITDSDDFEITHIEKAKND